MIEDIRSGQHQANFFEGMGCTGGCVGGPKVLLDRETGRENVDRYGDEAEFGTPLDNPMSSSCSACWALIRWRNFWSRAIFSSGIFKGSTERKGRAVIFRLSPAKVRPGS